MASSRFFDFVWILSFPSGRKKIPIFLLLCGLAACGPGTRFYYDHPKYDPGAPQFARDMISCGAQRSANGGVEIRGDERKLNQVHACMRSKGHAISRQPIDVQFSYAKVGVAERSPEFEADFLSCGGTETRQGAYQAISVTAYTLNRCMRNRGYQVSRGRIQSQEITLSQDIFLNNETYSENPRQFGIDAKACGARENSDGINTIYGADGQYDSFKRCMADRGYAYQRKGPNNPVNMFYSVDGSRVPIEEVRTIWALCGGRIGENDQGFLPDGKEAEFYDCMKRRGFRSTAIPRSPARFFLWHNPQHSMTQHKLDYSLCGLDFTEKGSVNLLSTSGDNALRFKNCIEGRGYQTIPVTNDFRVLWRNTRTGETAGRADVLECGLNGTFTSNGINLSRLLEIAVCLESEQFEIADYGQISEGFPIVYR